MWLDFALCRRGSALGWLLSIKSLVNPIVHSSKINCILTINPWSLVSQLLNNHVFIAGDQERNLAATKGDWWSWDLVVKWRVEGPKWRVATQQGFVIWNDMIMHNHSMQWSLMATLIQYLKEPDAKHRTWNWKIKMLLLPVRERRTRMIRRLSSSHLKVTCWLPVQFMNEMNAAK